MWMELLDRLTTASSFSGRDMNHAVEMYTVDEVKGPIQRFTPVNVDTYKTLTSAKWNNATSPQQTTQNVSMGNLSTRIEPVITLLLCETSRGCIDMAKNGTNKSQNIGADKWWKITSLPLMTLVKKNIVHKNGQGCVGASHDGYSVFYLVGINNNHFKPLLLTTVGWSKKACRVLDECGSPIGTNGEYLEQLIQSTLLTNWSTSTWSRVVRTIIFCRAGIAGFPGSSIEAN